MKKVPTEKCHLFLKEVPGIINNTQGSGSATASTAITSACHILTIQLMTHPVSSIAFKVLQSIFAHNASKLH